MAFIAGVMFRHEGGIIFSSQKVNHLIGATTTTPPRPASSHKTLRTNPTGFRITIILKEYEFSFSVSQADPLLPERWLLSRGADQQP